MPDELQACTAQVHARNCSSSSGAAVVEVVHEASNASYHSQMVCYIEAAAIRCNSNAIFLLQFMTEFASACHTRPQALELIDETTNIWDLRTVQRLYHTHQRYTWCSSLFSDSSMYVCATSPIPANYTSVLYHLTHGLCTLLCCSLLADNHMAETVCSALQNALDTVSLDHVSSSNRSLLADSGASCPSSVPARTVLSSLAVNLLETATEFSHSAELCQQLLHAGVLASVVRLLELVPLAVDTDVRLVKATNQV